MFIDNKRLKEAFFKGIFALLVILVYKSLFGKENTSMGFMISIGAISFLRLNLLHNIKFKIINLISLSIFLLFASYIASLNIFLGVIINFSVFFIIIYIYTNNKKSSISYIFLFIYIYMVSIPIKPELIFKRFLALMFGILLIFTLQFIFNRNKNKETIKDFLIKDIDKLIYKIDCALKNDIYNYNKLNLEDSFRKTLSFLKTDYSSFFKPSYYIELFNIIVGLENLNFIIDSIFYGNKTSSINKAYLLKLKVTLSIINDLINSKCNLIYLDNYLKSIYLNFKDYNYIKPCNDLLKFIYDNILILHNKKKSFDLSLSLSSFKYNFIFKPFSFKYSLKVATAMSLAIFLINLFNFDFSRWILTTVYVLIQPFSDQTITKTKKRIKGTLIGALIFIFICPILLKFVPIYLVLFVSLIFYFYAKEYSINVIFTCLLTLSLSVNGNISPLNLDLLSLSRFSFIFIGSSLAVFFEMYLFNYTLDKHLNSLINNYKNLTYKILSEYKNFVKNNKNSNNIIFLILKHNYEEDHILFSINDKNSNNKKDLMFINRNKSIVKKMKFLFLQNHLKHKKW